MVINVFGEKYLCKQYSNLAIFMDLREHCEFPGMLGNIDCMHWKNYLSSCKGMYLGHVHKPTIILEVVTSYDLWI